MKHFFSPIFGPENRGFFDNGNDDFDGGVPQQNHNHHYRQNSSHHRKDTFNQNYQNNNRQDFENYKLNNNPFIKKKSKDLDHHATPKVSEPTLKPMRNPKYKDDKIFDV